MTQPLKKPMIWFDIDDTLVDTAAQIHASLLTRTQKDIPVSSWLSMMFTDFYGIGLDNVETMRGWWREDKILEKASWINGAKDALLFFAAQGHEIGLITARAWHPGAKAITEQWIQAENIPVSDLILLPFGQSKAQALAQQKAPILAFVDDSFEHVTSVSDLVPHTALIRQPWNQSHTHFGGVLPSVAAMPAWLAMCQAHLSAQTPSAPIAPRPKS